jgi:NAD(P)-dependent dehydrogenase (short-subunit alcohol dehydrogenase family)
MSIQMENQPPSPSFAAWRMPQLAGTATPVPDQTGRRALVTGANSGIGFPAARELARAGAHVILAARDRSRGEAAIARLKTEIPAASVELGLLDLASLDSVRDFAARELDRGLPLDILVNNAGVMAPPKRLQTSDGFELQFGTNVLGHFALTGLLLPAIEGAVANSAARRPQSPRIVFLASIAHKRGRIRFDDLQSTWSYNPMGSYQQSKLADLILAFELQRRLKARGSKVLSLAAHPGVANTNLFHSGDFNPLERAARRLIGHVMDAFLNSQDEGALPTLYAALAPEAQPGGYYGPQGFQEMRGGDVGNAIVAPQATDANTAAHLWNLCEQLTGVTFP